MKSKNVENSSSLNKLIAILGPTASGKSNLAINLAKKFNGEIINADSRSFYKGLTIGTAKPDKDDRVLKSQKWIRNFKKNGPIVSKKVIHWLIDIASVKDPISVGIYKPIAYEVIDDILSRKKVPFLVGGSGLYSRAVLENFSIPIVIPDYELRKKLEKFSTKKLAEKFKKLDPLSVQYLDLNNRRRLIRAIEVVTHTGKPYFQLERNYGIPYSVLKIGIKTDGEQSAKKINNRVKEMIKEGWLKEVERFHKEKLDKTVIFQNTIGYPQLLKVLKGEMSMHDAIYEIQLKTRQFSKRQRTWFKKEKGIVWIKNQKQAESKIKRFLNK